MDAGDAMDAGRDASAAEDAGGDAHADDARSVVEDAVDTSPPFDALPTAADGSVLDDSGGLSDDASLEPASDGSVEAGAPRDGSAGLDADSEPSPADPGCACRATTHRSRFGSFTLAALLLVMLRRAKSRAVESSARR